MDESLMFNKIRELCCYCGFAIDVIAEDCHIPQDMVAKMFLETFRTILEKMESE